MRTILSVNAKPGVLFSGDYDTRKDMIEAAADAVSLRNANLRYERLCSAELGSLHAPGANFEGSDFRGANLSCANLRGANLAKANMEKASLMCEDLDSVVELLSGCEAAKPEAENIPPNKE